MPARAELADRVEQVRQVFALPHVDTERDAAELLAGTRDEVGKRRNERRGQVVDAEEADVLEALDGEALARPAHAGDDDEGDAVGHRALGQRRLGASRR